MVASIIIVVIAILICVFFAAITISDEHAKEEEKKNKSMQLKIEEENRIKKINSVKQFAENNGLHIKYLFDEKDRLYNMALRHYLCGIVSKPLIPTHVKAKYSGTVTDYVAQQINKEKDEHYQNLLKESNQDILISGNYVSQMKAIEIQIINKLKPLPDSQKYIDILVQCFEEDRKILDK